MLHADRIFWVLVLHDVMYLLKIIMSVGWGWGGGGFYRRELAVSPTGETTISLLYNYHRHGCV